MAQSITRAEPRTDSELAITALRFARRVHLGQHRKQTQAQFVEHPIEVARLLSEAGVDGSLLVAAYLHDVVEKTSIGLDEIAERFGADVASVVDALTDDPSLDEYATRKRALRDRVLTGGRGPVLIYAADRVANMRDWQKVAPEYRDEIAARLGTNLPERLELWSEDLEELTAYDPELPFLPDMEIELLAIRSDAGLDAAA
jgi:guanosine-3',5'-bis(diphosphate) 3'-pyrophosphohydrolase